MVKTDRTSDTQPPGCSRPVGDGVSPDAGGTHTVQVVVDDRCTLMKWLRLRSVPCLTVRRIWPSPIISGRPQRDRARNRRGHSENNTHGHPTDAPIQPFGAVT